LKADSDTAWAAAAVADHDWALGGSGSCGSCCRPLAQLEPAKVTARWQGQGTVQLTWRSHVMAVCYQ